MHVSFETDEFGRLVCTLATGESRTAIVASDPPEAISSLLAAVDSAAASGCGECYWRQPGGEYRWMLRREGAQVRVAILWMVGVLTGWEHVYWGECDFARFAAEVRSHLQPFQPAAAN